MSQRAAATASTTWIYWGAPQQLDDQLGSVRAEAYERDYDSTTDAYNQAVVGRRLKMYPLNKAVDVEQIDVDEGLKRLGCSNWGAWDRTYRSCFFAIPESDLVEKFALDHVENLEMFLPGLSQRRDASPQMATAVIGDYHALPVTVAGIWTDVANRSDRNHNISTHVAGREYHWGQEKERENTRLDEHPLYRPSVGAVQYMFEVPPPDKRAGFSLRKLIKADNTRLCMPGGIHTKLRLPSGKSVDLPTVFDDDDGYHTGWEPYEEAVCVNDIWFPYKHSIPSRLFRREEVLPAGVTRTIWQHLEEMAGDVFQQILLPMLNNHTLVRLHEASRASKTIAGATVAQHLRKHMMRPVGTLTLRPCCNIDHSGYHEERCTKCPVVPQINVAVPLHFKTFKAVWIIIPELVWRVMLQRHYPRQSEDRYSSSEPKYRLQFRNFYERQKSYREHFFDCEYRGIHSFRMPPPPSTSSSSGATSFPAEFLAGSHLVRCRVWQVDRTIDVPIFSHNSSSCWDHVWQVRLDREDNYRNVEPQITWTISRWDLHNAQLPWDVSGSDGEPNSTLPPEARYACSNVNQSSVTRLPLVFAEYQLPKMPGTEQPCDTSQHPALERPGKRLKT